MTIEHIVFGAVAVWFFGLVGLGLYTAGLAHGAKVGFDRGVGTVASLAVNREAKADKQKTRQHGRAAGALHAGSGPSTP